MKTELLGVALLTLACGGVDTAGLEGRVLVAGQEEATQETDAGAVPDEIEYDSALGGSGGTGTGSNQPPEGGSGGTPVIDPPEPQGGSGGVPDAGTDPTDPDPPPLPPPPVTTYQGDLVLSTPAHIVAADTYVTIAGSVTIGNMPTLPDLAGLETLRMIEGDLTIQNTQFVSLAGLSNLTAVGGTIRIMSNSVLEVVVLPSLEDVGGGFNVSLNGDTLWDFDTPALRTLGGSLYVTYNRGLTSVNMPYIEAMTALVFSTNNVMSECIPQAIRMALWAYDWDDSYTSSGNLPCAGTCNGYYCE